MKKSGYIAQGVILLAILGAVVNAFVLLPSSRNDQPVMPIAFASPSPSPAAAIATPSPMPAEILTTPVLQEAVTPSVDIAPTAPTGSTSSLLIMFVSATAIAAASLGRSFSHVITGSVAANRHTIFDDAGNSVVE